MLISSNVNLSRGGAENELFLPLFIGVCFSPAPPECAAQWDNTCPGPKSGSRGRDRLVCRHLQRPPSAATPPHVAHQSGTDLGLSFTHVTSPPSRAVLSSDHEGEADRGRVTGFEEAAVSRVISSQNRRIGSTLGFTICPATTIGPNGSLPFPLFSSALLSKTDNSCDSDHFFPLANRAPGWLWLNPADYSSGRRTGHPENVQTFFPRPTFCPTNLWLSILHEITRPHRFIRLTTSLLN
jgi:hypothetical protein